jgi:hypothetical protein
LRRCCSPAAARPAASERQPSGSTVPRIAFYQEVHSDRAPAHTTDDAAALAEATRDFSRAVDRTHSRDELQPSFDRLAERYHHVRQQVESRDSHYYDSSLAFERVTEAYLDVDRALNHPESSYRN